MNSIEERRGRETDILDMLDMVVVVVVSGRRKNRHRAE
jgi:hypothetical protein